MKHPVEKKADNKMQQVQKFLDCWQDDTLGTKPVFLSMFQDLLKKDRAGIEFHERPGISYSLRGIRKDRKDRPLFVMVDVIDDDPKKRWISVCFYGDMIEDPDEQGDLIPGGLLGSDGYCFDIIDSDESVKEYVVKRIQEAYENTFKSL
jgi:hypothetical protein